MVKIEVTALKNVSATEMQEGHMYERAGIYYICNKWDDVIAFSICGKWTVTERSPQHGYSEVDGVISIRNHAK